MKAKQRTELHLVDLHANDEADVPAPQPPTPPKRRIWLRVLIWSFLLLLLVVLVLLVMEEMRTSRLQSREFSRYAKTLTHEVQPGPSDAIRFPQDGPFDKRLGYVLLPMMQQRLIERGFEIRQQARFSPALMEYTGRGLFAPYVEKTLAGISIDDCRGDPFYRFRYPQRHYRDFGAIPPLVLQSLLFIENQHLLSDKYPLANPAVDWPRFTKAALSQVGKVLEVQDDTSGGSTLATQVEKYRHSPDGLTLTPAEKLRQMFSASVRAYQGGPETLAARKRIALDYLNSVPLSAAPGHGEINGLGDGLWVWFGADFERINLVLDPARNQEVSLAEQGVALRQVIALMIAHRRPSYYLAQGREELTGLTDSYLRLLTQNGVIDAELRDVALAQRLDFRDFTQTPAIEPVDTNKGILVARNRLSRLLGLPYYDLDRLDLTAKTSLHRQLQEEASQYLRRLADPKFAEEVGLFGERLLSPEKTGDVRYSFTLFERTPHGFLVRAQTDNTDQPFDINEGSKLELGSTAKLRVLTTYLEIIAELHERYAAEPLAQLRKVPVPAQDPLSRWALDYLIRAQDRSLPAMLQAALERHYSASPGEAFFTGGGLHTFSNFRREDNGRMPTLREALQESINLPFVRLMRDIVRYTTYQGSDSRVQLLSDDKDPRRLEYLTRFADREGKTYLLRFWRKYRGKSSDERLEIFFDGLRPTASRLAAVHRYLMPKADEATFSAFLRQRVAGSEKLTDKRIHALYESYGPGAYNLPDQGYIARVHPLELWLLGYLLERPQASFEEAVQASQAQRQEVYGWLFKSRHRSARDVRIRTMLEVEAFTDIHLRWQRVGYPFDHLVPSLATAIGSSGDRPAALAELMGIILNDGVRLPTLRIDQLHFAADTPYETEIVPTAAKGERVLPAAVATALREVLSQVVDAGTARRLAGSFKLVDGSPLVMGGKTGTGDNRIETVGRYGNVIQSRARNRTATFVFFLGRQHFGTLTAYVPGSASDKFRFTSALPVQVLKGMAPLLQPYLEPGANTLCLAPTRAGTP